MPSSPKSPGDLSSLTKAQIDTLKIHSSFLRHEINMNSALKVRKSSGISRGTHYRVLSQAKRNIRESLFTVVTAVQLGLLNPREIEKLIGTASLIPLDVDPDRLPEVMGLVEALVERIVML